MYTLKLKKKKRTSPWKTTVEKQNDNKQAFQKPRQSDICPCLSSLICYLLCPPSLFSAPLTCSQYQESGVGGDSHIAPSPGLDLVNTRRPQRRGMSPGSRVQGHPFTLHPKRCPQSVHRCVCVGVCVCVCVCVCETTLMENFQ